jgi:hypothetical protein
VSYEHRFRMCQLAFLSLNDDDRIHTKVVISDAEYMSWKYAVNDMYVMIAVNVLIYLFRKKTFDKLM